MHSLAPYSIRVHDNKLAGQVNEKYHKLGNIRGHDLIDVFKDFTKSKENKYHTVNYGKQKKTIRFTNTTSQERIISGFIEHGDYGQKGKIVDVENGKTKYQKTSTDSDIMQLYFCIHIPRRNTTGILLFHNIQGKGVKTIIHKLFNEYFSDKTDGLKIQMEPLASENAVKEWMEESEVKELRLTSYSPKTDVTDIIDQLSENSVELTYKPEKRGGSFGSLLNFIKRDSDNELSNVVAVLGKHCQTVKAVVKLGSRKRLFTLSSQLLPYSSVEFDESDVEMDEGMPLFESINKFSKELISDFQSNM